jgi:hypothetical protein
MGLFALVALPAAGCSCAEDTGMPDGSAQMDAGRVADAAATDGSAGDAHATDAAPTDGGAIDGAADGAAADDTGTGDDSSVVVDDTGAVDAATITMDTGPTVCGLAMCQTHLYQCGNCVDDDGDGLVDAADPDCLGPCGNNEAGFQPMIPGISLTNCTADCFYDQDGGSGNDGCVYDYRCDMLSPDVDPGGPGGTTHCAYSAAISCPPTQTMMCHDVCGPLTPNGCDCFGCCEVTPGSGDYVFVGSNPDPGHDPCSRATLSDPASCRPCTPVADCLNPCDHCELCFGRSTLPADCFPPPPVDAGTDAGFDAAFPDGGHPDAFVPPVDSGVPPNDAYVPPRCPAGSQPCGLPTDPPCPVGDYCITGCCQFFG